MKKLRIDMRLGYYGDSPKNLAMFVQREDETVEDFVEQIVAQLFKDIESLEEEGDDED